MIKYYSFFDTDLHLYNKPFAAADDKSAIKFTRDLLLGADDSVFSKVINITELHYLGKFDENTGIFTSFETGAPVLVCKLVDIPLSVRNVVDPKEVI